MRILAAFLLLLSLAACSGDNDVTQTTVEPPTTQTSVATTPPVTTTEPATTTTVPAVTTTAVATTTEIVLVIVEGEVDGGGRVDVPLGNTVMLVVTSDEAGEVHVHGYDLFVDLEADIEATLTFVADIPGIFEVELEGSHLLLVELVVQ